MSEDKPSLTVGALKEILAPIDDTLPVVLGQRMAPAVDVIAKKSYAVNGESFCQIVAERKPRKIS